MRIPLVSLPLMAAVLIAAFPTNASAQCMERHQLEIGPKVVLPLADSKELLALTGGGLVQTLLMGDKAKAAVEQKGDQMLLVVIMAMVEERQKVRKETEASVGAKALQQHALPNGTLMMTVSRAEKTGFHFYSFALYRKDLPTVVYVSVSPAPKGTALSAEKEEALRRAVQDLCVREI